MKDELLNNTKLYHSDRNKPYNLYTDTSDHVIGAILQQDEKVIVIYSKKLTDTETRYSITEKEAFSIIKDMYFFRYFTLGQHTTVSTDSRELLSIQDIPCNQIARWFLLLTDFPYGLQHIDGKRNMTEDALSSYTASIDIHTTVSSFNKEYFIKTVKILQTQLNQPIIIPNTKAKIFCFEAHTYLGYI